jgi:hypothetical protein
MCDIFHCGVSLREFKSSKGLEGEKPERDDGK